MEDAGYAIERRISRRFTITIPSSYIDPVLNRTVDALTHDISREGTGIISEKRLAPGTIVEFCLCMADNKEKIFVKGTVIWLNRLENNRYRIGIKLDGPRLGPISLVLRTIQAQLNAKPSNN